MNYVHIIGRQNNGKTTLIVALIKELTKIGLRVGTIKHTSHRYELDTPGKDSYRHRQAGSIPAAIVTAEMAAIYLPQQAISDPLEQLAPFFRETDLVLIEGFRSGPGRKIEVYRACVGSDPLVFEQDDIDAVITDDTVETTIPVWPRSNIAVIAKQICRMAGIQWPPNGDDL